MKNFDYDAYKKLVATTAIDGNAIIRCFDSVSDYVDRVVKANAHNESTASISIPVGNIRELNELCKENGVAPVFTGDIGNKKNVKDFCMEYVETLFANRRIARR